MVRIENYFLTKKNVLNSFKAKSCLSEAVDLVCVGVSILEQKAIGLSS